MGKTKLANDMRVSLIDLRTHHGTIKRLLQFTALVSWDDGTEEEIDQHQLVRVGESSRSWDEIDRDHLRAQLARSPRVQEHGEIAEIVPFRHITPITNQGQDFGPSAIEEEYIAKGIIAPDKPIR